MIDFLLDNPYIAIFVLYGLFSLLFGKKKKGAAEQAKQARGAARIAKGAGAQAQVTQAAGNEDAEVQAQASQVKYRSKIEEALRNAMKEADREFFEERPLAEERPAGKPLQPKTVTPAGMVDSAKADPFAFHSVMSGGEMSGGEKGKIDYDLTGVDYDTQKPDAFAFHEASAKPAEQEYHLTGFQAYHSAHGLSAEDRQKIAAGDVPAAFEAGPAFSVSNPAELRRAIIVQEVLGKPKALRKV
jgi:hypothetical protein